MKKILLRVLIAVIIINPINAEEIKLEISDFGSCTGVCARVLKDLLRGLQSDINQKVDNTLGGIDLKKYLQGFANASVISLKGLGATYGNFEDYVIIGTTGSTSLVTKDLSLKDLSFDSFEDKFKKFQGLGLQASIMAGVNLEKFLASTTLPTFLKRTKIYANFLTASFTFPIFEEAIISSTSFGIHAQNKILDGVSYASNLLRWGGIDLTTGFEYGFNGVDLKQSLGFTERGEENQTTGKSLSAKLDSMANLGIEIYSFSIPFEASTNVGIGWDWLFGLDLSFGMGIDMNFGSAKNISKLDISGNFTGNLIKDVKNPPEIKGLLDLGQKAGPTFGDLRFFGGPEISLFKTRLFIHTNYAIASQNLFGLTFGVRVSF